MHDLCCVFLINSFYNYPFSEHQSIIKGHDLILHVGPLPCHEGKILSSDKYLACIPSYFKMLPIEWSKSIQSHDN